jgi:hypothetical protein
VNHAFLRNSDGDFDYAAALISAFFAFVIVGSIREIYRAHKYGRILLAWSFTYGGSGQCLIYRKEKPGWFWLVYALYYLSIVFMSAIVICFCFGLLRDK